MILDYIPEKSVNLLVSTYTLCFRKKGMLIRILSGSVSVKWYNKYIPCHCLLNYYHCISTKIQVPPPHHSLT